MIGAGIIVGAVILSIAGAIDIMNYFDNGVQRKFQDYMKSTTSEFITKVFYEVVEVTKKPYGWDMIVKCKDGGCYDDFKGRKGELDKLYKADCTITDIKYTNQMLIQIVSNPVREMDYKPIQLSPYELLVGHTNTGEILTVDMRKTPHVGVTGTSCQGKSKCVEGMLKNLKGAKIHLVNCFEDDFTGVYAEKRIVGADNIYDYLIKLLVFKVERKCPLYVVIDEFNVLNNTKGMSKAIADLLAQARHYNIFVICIMQSATKEDCKFKGLFNIRISFKNVEGATLNAFLGTTVSNDLDRQEFYLLSDGIYRGRTFNI